MVATNKSFENSLMTFLGMLQAILLQASKNSTIYMKEHCDSTYIQCQKTTLSQIAFSMIAMHNSCKNYLKILQACCKLLLYRPLRTPLSICMSFAGTLPHLFQNVASSSTTKCMNFTWQSTIPSRTLSRPGKLAACYYFIAQQILRYLHVQILLKNLWTFARMLQSTISHKA